MGKIHLTSGMDERETMTKIRSVFSKSMKDHLCFKFSILHCIGGGSKSLTVPRTSASFVWNARKSAKLLVEDQSIYWPRMTWVKSRIWVTFLTMPVMEVSCKYVI